MVRRETGDADTLVATPLQVRDAELDNTEANSVECSDAEVDVPNSEQSHTSQLRCVA